MATVTSPKTKRKHLINMSIESPDFKASADRLGINKQSKIESDLPSDAELNEMVYGPEAVIQTPPSAESRITRFMKSGADKLVDLGASVESAANKYQGIVENGREKFTSAKDRIRGFGRSALDLYRTSKDTAASLYENRHDLYLNGRAHVELGVENTVSAAKDKASELKDTTLNYVDATKQKIDLGIDDAKSWASDKVEAGIDKASQLKENAEVTFQQLKMSYAARRNEIVGIGTEKIEAMKGFFIDKKNAALRRKMDREATRSADKLSIQRRKELFRRQQEVKKQAGKLALNTLK